MTLPLAWRGLAAGAVLAFARALGDFGATLMVAGNIPGVTRTAALAIYDAVQVNDAARAGWLTLWISALSIAALWLVQRTLPARGPGVERRPEVARRPRQPPGPSGLTLDVDARAWAARCGVVFGPSGAGKTTLLRLIAGLERPDRGRVRLGDTVLFDAGARINRPLRARGSA